MQTLIILKPSLFCKAWLVITQTNIIGLLSIKFLYTIAHWPKSATLTGWRMPFTVTVKWHSYTVFKLICESFPCQKQHVEHDYTQFIHSALIMWYISHFICVWIQACIQSLRPPYMQSATDWLIL